MARYITSDHHFGHANIIDYADRPFESVDEMDRDLADRWNATVTDADVVYHLGDLCMGGPSAYERWIRELNGSFVLIRGNHDRFDPTAVGFPVLDACELTVDDLVLTLRHNPEPWDGDGWLVHGHSHGKRPAMDGHARRASVCVENTGYAPLPVEAVADAIYDGLTFDSWRSAEHLRGEHLVG